MTTKALTLTGTADATAGPPSTTSRELDRFTLTRAQLGDPRAFSTLVRLYEARVRAFVVRMCGGNPALADDMLQETFLRVFRSLPGFVFEGRAKLSTWIMTLATRTVIDDRRRAWSRLTMDDQIQEIADRRSGPGEHADAAALRRTIDRALLDVSEPLRATFALRIFCELSEAETAEVMGVDVGTVKSRVSRVREHLRRALAHTGGY